VATMADSFSIERRKIMKALGATSRRFLLHRRLWIAEQKFA